MKRQLPMGSKLHYQNVGNVQRHGVNFDRIKDWESVKDMSTLHRRNGWKNPEQRRQDAQQTTFQDGMSETQCTSGRFVPVNRPQSGDDCNDMAHRTPSVKEIVRQLETESMSVNSIILSAADDDEYDEDDDVSDIPEYTSEDEDNTDLKHPFSVDLESDMAPSEREMLLEMIQNLKREQEELRKMHEAQVREQERLRQQQEDHQKQLSALVHRQPSFKLRIRSMLLAERLTGQPPHVPTRSLTPSDAPTPHRPMEEAQNHQAAQNNVESEHIYAQIEELYRNWHRLHFYTANGAQDPIYSEIGDGAVRVNPRYKNLRLWQDAAHVAPQMRRLRRCSGENGVPFNPRVRGLRHSRSVSGIDDMDGAADYASIDSVLEGRPLPMPTRRVSGDPPAEVVFSWTIQGFMRRFSREKQSPGISTKTPGFYLFHCGYRVRLETYLNGNGMCANNAMSIFLRVVPGDYDEYLPWPMAVHLAVTLVNPRDEGERFGLKSSEKTSKECFQYNRPAGFNDADWDAWGFIEFIKHDMLKGHPYIQNDSFKLRCRVWFDKPVNLTSLPLN